MPFFPFPVVFLNGNDTEPDPTGSQSPTPTVIEPHHVVDGITTSTESSIQVIFDTLGHVLDAIINHPLLCLIFLLPVGFLFVHWVIRFLRFKGR